MGCDTGSDGLGWGRGVIDLFIGGFVSEVLAATSLLGLLFSVFSVFC